MKYVILAVLRYAYSRCTTSITWLLMAPYHNGYRKVSKPFRLSNRSEICTSIAALPRCPSNVSAIRSLQHPILRLRDLIEARMSSELQHPLHCLSNQKNMSLSSPRKDYHYLRHLCVEKCHKIYIHYRPAIGISFGREAS